MRIALLVLGLLTFVSATHAGSLDKAEAYKSNGLLTEAKRELVEITSDELASPADKAEAYLLLGDIAIDEAKPDVAKENWKKIIDQFGDQPIARLAGEKLALLEKLSSGPQPPQSAVNERRAYSPGTVLVMGPDEYPWSVPQIAGALGTTAVPFDGSMMDAIAIAKADENVAGLVEIGLAVDTAFESGRVVCMSPTGKKLWEEKVMFNLGGGEERVARRFVDNLASKVAKKKCPPAAKK